MKSLFRWIGQSSQTWQQIIDLLPKKTAHTYCEPFVGAGWVYLNLLINDYAKHYIINDANIDIVNFWLCVKHIPDELIKQIQDIEQQENTETGDAFDKVKQEYNNLARHIESMPNAYRAALFAYIGQFAFRGLTAWNQDGALRSKAGTSEQGRYKRPSTRMTEINDISRRMKTTTITHGDFASVPLTTSEETTIVFLAPPYFDTLQTHNHPDHAFTIDDQIRVRDFALQICNYADVLCLNAAKPELVSLYSQYDNFDIQYINKNTHLKTRAQITHKTNYDFIAKTWGHSNTMTKETVIVRSLPINDVHPNDYNPNRMSSQQLSTLTASIRQHGMTMPITITPDMTIIDGEHRWRVCQSLGHTKIPVVMLDEANAKLATLQYNLGRGGHDEEAEKAVIDAIFDDLGSLDEFYEAHLMSTHEADNLFEAWMREQADESDLLLKDEIMPPTEDNAGGANTIVEDQEGNGYAPDEVPITFMVPRARVNEVAAAVKTMLSNNL